LDLSPPNTSDNIDSVDDMLSGELIDLGNIGVTIGLQTLVRLEAEKHDPALKIDC
jgi:hypothetical protein